MPTPLHYGLIAWGIASITGGGALLRFAVAIDRSYRRLPTIMFEQALIQSGGPGAWRVGGLAILLQGLIFGIAGAVGALGLAQIE